MTTRNTSREGDTSSVPVITIPAELIEHVRYGVLASVHAEAEAFASAVAKFMGDPDGARDTYLDARERLEAQLALADLLDGDAEVDIPAGYRALIAEAAEYEATGMRDRIGEGDPDQLVAEAETIRALEALC